MKPVANAMGVFCCWLATYQLPSARSHASSASRPEENGTESKSCATSGNAFIQRARAVSKQADQLLELQANMQSIRVQGLHQTSNLVAGSGSHIKIVTYNLYWWNVANNNRWNDLHNRIKEEGPFDLIGFQECENVESILKGSGLLYNFDSFQGPSKPNSNPAPLAWDRTAFSKIGGPGYVSVGSDRWGERIMTWVRLRHVASGVNVFFANHHGPLGDCGNGLGDRLVKGVVDNKGSEDIAFMTGDFNCGTGTASMNKIKALLTGGIDGGIDQILTTGVTVSGGRKDGWPSDHPLVQGTFSLEDETSAPSTTTTSTTATTSGTKSNVYGKVSGVGAWGGWCTCPDGQRYNVGDKNDGCEQGPASLACVGGVPGECVKEVDGSRDGMKVTCATDGAPSTPAPSTTTTAASTTTTATALPTTTVSTTSRSVVPSTGSVTWIFHPALNCWEGHGATAIAGEKDPLDGVFTFESCKSECASRPACVAFVIRSNLADGSSPCWLRQGLMRQECQVYPDFDTWEISRDANSESSERRSL